MFLYKKKHNTVLIICNCNYCVCCCCIHLLTDFVEPIYKLLKINFTIIVRIELFIQYKQILFLLLITWFDHVTELFK